MSDEQARILDRKLAEHLEEQPIPTSLEIAEMYERLTHRPFDPVRHREDSEPLTGFQICMIILAVLVIAVTLSAAF